MISFLIGDRSMFQHTIEKCFTLREVTTKDKKPIVLSYTYKIYDNLNNFETGNCINTNMNCKKNSELDFFHSLKKLDTILS